MIQETKIQIYIEFKSGDKIYTLDELKRELEAIKGQPSYQFFTGLAEAPQPNIFAPANLSMDLSNMQ